MDFTLKRILLASMAISLLTGCGLRGGLERAEPVFRDVKPVKPVEQVVEPAPEVEIRVRPKTNAHGGELPVPAPTREVESNALPDVQTSN